MKYLSAKNTSWIIIAAAIIGSAFIISRYGNSDAKLAYEQNNSIVSGDATTTDISYQGNWQKTLTGTIGSSTWSFNPATSTQSNEKLTITQSFGRELFGRYLSLQEAGTAADPQSQQEVVGKVLSNGTFVVQPTLHTKKDLRIRKDLSKASVVRYGNDVGAILTRLSLKNRRNETDIVQDSLNKNDPAVLKELNPIIVSYKNILAALLATEVPENLADKHLNLINGMTELVFADESLQKTFSDGLVSIQGLGIYQNGLILYNDSFNALVVYFMTNGVMFGPRDGGYVFSQTTS